MLQYFLTKKENRYFDVAKSVAKTSDYYRHHIGCVVVYNKNNVLSVASNSNKTHSLQKLYNQFRNFDTSETENKLHAEIHALSWLVGKPVDWSKVSLYTYREHSNGKPAISKPCPACQKLINDLGIRTVYYIDEKGQKVKEKL